MILIIAWEASTLNFRSFHLSCHLDGIYFGGKDMSRCHMLSKPDALIGYTLPTQQFGEKRLNKFRALAAFFAGCTFLHRLCQPGNLPGIGRGRQRRAGIFFPHRVCIAGLLGIVALSYFQTIHGYPSGGGSYIVAKENLGEMPGLIAAAALLIDYVLTAAVSLTAGVEAIASAFPALWDFRVEVALVILLVITLINLRGVQEQAH